MFRSRGESRGERQRYICKDCSMMLQQTIVQWSLGWCSHQLSCHNIFLVIGGKIALAIILLYAKQKRGIFGTFVKAALSVKGD